MTDPNVFVQFTNPTYYPRPVSNYLPVAPVATNSWFENALSTQINDSDRIVNTNPWYWLPRYQNPIGLALDHQLNQNTSVVLSNGNFAVQNNPSSSGVFNLPSNDIKINQLYDMSAEMTLITGSGSIKAYPTRGSVLATLDYTTTPIELELLTQGIISLTAIAGGYQLETSGVKVSAVSEDLYPSGSNYITKFMTIYNGVIPTSDKVEITMSPNSVNFKFFNYDLTRALNTSTLQTLLPAGVTQFTSNKNVIGFTVQDGNITYTMSVNTQTKTATFIKSVPAVYGWLLYTTATLSVVNKKIQTGANFTGLLQIAALGSDASQYTSLTNLYNNYIGKYTKKFDTSNYSTTTFDLNLDLVGNKTLLLLPVHWNNYTLNNATKLNSTFFDLVYGNMAYYEFTNNTSNVDLGSFTIPTQFDVSGLSSVSKEILSTYVLDDSEITSIDADLNPYDFGQQAATAGSIIALAKVLNIDTNSKIVALKDTLKTALVKWLTNTNKEIYRLNYESVWKGVIVPADSDAVVTNGPTAYGNSFYNDHHFHYGYIIYAIWCVELYENTLSTTYPKQINNIIYDVCNPDSASTFSTKLRNKDFYAGHAWATGIGVPSGTTSSKSSAVRQQESSAEAINCYYACYLLANQLSNNDVLKIASIALKLELDASKNYYQLFGNGTSYGDFTKVAGIGIVLNIGKAFTLDWNMQPNSYNGRVIGLYGIQSIPFTEISFEHVSTNWTNKIATNTTNLYQITSVLIEGLTDNSYTPLLEDISGDNFDVKTEGGFWGNVGNMLLAPAPVVTDDSIGKSWHNLIQKQQSLGGGNTAIKNFSSYSNTLYWLMRYDRFAKPLNGQLTQVNLMGINVLFFHQDGTNTTRIIITGCNGCGKVCIDTDFDLNALLVGEGTLGEKGLSLNQDPNDILNYAAIKLALQNNVNTVDDPQLFMSQSNDNLFQQEMKENICNYNKYIGSYIGFSSFFK